MERETFDHELKNTITGEFERYYDLDGYDGSQEAQAWDDLADALDSDNDYNGITYEEVREWLHNRVWAYAPDNDELGKAINECYESERENAYEDLDDPNDFIVDGSYFDLDVYWFVAPEIVNMVKPGDKIVKFTPCELLDYYRDNVAGK